MGCVLRLHGEELDVDALISSQKLIPAVTWKNGQERTVAGRFHTNSGANFVVSHADIDDFSAQIADAESYLATNHEEILKLTSAHGVVEAILDFAVATRPEFATQTSNFSVLLLRRMANLNLGLTVSHYPTEHDIQ